MSIRYQARLEDAFGAHIKTFSNFTDPTDGGGAGLDYILNVSSDSSCLLTVPAYEDLNKFQEDYRIVPMRSLHGRPFYNDNQACYMIRKKVLTRQWFRFSARHANELIDRRSVAYNTGSSFANKTSTVAGNMIKAYLRENLGSSFSPANRDGSDDTGTDLVTPGYVSIEIDKGDGTSVNKTSDRGSMLGVVQDIANDSTTGGTYIGFMMLYQPDKTFQFFTRANQWGIDRRAGNPGQVIFAPERGNMGDWKLTIDYTDEVTVAFAGGRGQNDEKIIAQAIDLTRVNASPFNRRERYFDAPGGDTTALVQAVANARLREGQPQITLEFDVVETPSSTRGIHYDLGDLVTARVTLPNGFPFQYDYRMDTFYISVRHKSQSTRAVLSGPI